MEILWEISAGIKGGLLPKFAKILPRRVEAGKAGPSQTRKLLSLNDF
jgi:hypothetical protein